MCELAFYEYKKRWVERFNLVLDKFLNNKEFRINGMCIARNKGEVIFIRFMHDVLLIEHIHRDNHNLLLGWRKTILFSVPFCEECRDSIVDAMATNLELQLKIEDARKEMSEKDRNELGLW